MYINAFIYIYIYHICIYIYMFGTFSKRRELFKSNPPKLYDDFLRKTAIFQSHRINVWYNSPTFSSWCVWENYYIGRYPIIRDESSCWWFGNPVNSPVEVGIYVYISHYLQGLLHPGGCLDFWTINSDWSYGVCILSEKKSLTAQAMRQQIASEVPGNHGNPKGEIDWPKIIRGY